MEKLSCSKLGRIQSNWNEKLIPIGTSEAFVL